MTEIPQEQHIHHGRNIKKFREWISMKQDALAAALGDDWSQKKVSQLEAKEVIDDTILEQVAQVLNIPVKALEHYTDEAATTFFNTFNDNSNVNGLYAPNSIFNPTEEWRKAMDDNRSLHEENKALYERLLKTEQEKIAMMEQMIKQLMKG